MADTSTFSVDLRLQQDYQFLIDFGGMGELLADEPAPLGQGAGPNPTRLLAAAVANCLAASLLFALRKFHDDVTDLRATVQGTLERQDGRWRISQLDVTLNLPQALETLPHLERAMAQFEQFCVVTQSVRQGIPVTVSLQTGEANVS